MKVLTAAVVVTRVAGLAHAQAVGLGPDGDGFIDRAELDAGAKQRFERRDANKDGWLTGDELSGQGRVRGRP